MYLNFCNANSDSALYTFNIPFGNMEKSDIF